MRPKDEWKSNQPAQLLAIATYKYLMVTQLSVMVGDPTSTETYE